MKASKYYTISSNFAVDAQEQRSPPGSWHLSSLVYSLHHVSAAHHWHRMSS
jgi:hypothetical protein